jgi:hypothetical protein
MLSRASLRRRRAALAIALGLLSASPFLLIGHGPSPERAFSTCGYLSVSVTSVTATTVPLDTVCTTCPDNSSDEGPTGYHDNRTQVSIYLCVTPGL